MCVAALPPEVGGRNAPERAHRRVRGSMLLAVLVAVSTVVVDVGAQPASGATASFESLTDLSALLRLAESGDARAAFLLGMRYALGRETERDEAQALRWLELAAERGLAEAQYNLGVMYAGGRGVAADAERAARWYMAAAEQGLAEAEYNLGTMYAVGDGVGRDERRAAALFERAAERGVTEAAYNLAVLYQHGRGVAKDASAAERWYRRAAEDGYRPAVARLSALVGGEAGVSLSRTGVDPGKPRSLNPWLARLDPRHYTLQLLSHTDEASVRRFVERRFQGGEGNYFAFERDGVTWYSVVYGVYPSLRDAQGAIDGLSGELRELGPWVRKVGVIQKAAIR